MANYKQTGIKTEGLSISLSSQCGQYAKSVDLNKTNLKQVKGLTVISNELPKTTANSARTRATIFCVLRHGICLARQLD